ncbi:MAG: hypothetical protein CL678_06530 [Bdellovibrionaceae bacterium]|nr:hypothetical protein [Pseudobdellovibrionaceae bacterium]|tara:strand:- start:752 stop:1429 length:678 start_codon:yes stop_codon:yes gene_type:complete
MKIYLKQIKEEEQILDFNEKTPWVAQVLNQNDETSNSIVDKRRIDLMKGNRSASIQFHIRKLGEIFELKGEIETRLHLLCSLCGDPFPKPVGRRFMSLFTKDPMMAGLSPEEAKLGGARGTSGKAVQAHQIRRNDLNKDSLGSPDADIEMIFIQEDFIDLSAVLYEQIQLEVPFQPLKSDDCREGKCPNYPQSALGEKTKEDEGFEKHQPFASLKNFKVRDKKKS